MFKKLAYSLICVSFLIIQGHNVIIHHHDEHHEHQNANHGHEEDHNAFSLVDFYSEFIPQDRDEAQSESAAFLSHSVLQISLCQPTINCTRIVKNEYPPPSLKLSFKSLRAPPVSSSC